MLGVVENAVRIERPMPAARSFKAQDCAAGEVGDGLCLSAFGGEFYAVCGQHTLHFLKVGLTVVAEIFAYIFGGGHQQHCKDSLTALQVGGFSDIAYVHNSPLKQTVEEQIFILNTI